MDPTQALTLDASLRAEAERLIDAAVGEQFGLGEPFSGEELARRVGALESLTEPLARAAAVWAYWLNSSDTRLMPNIVARLANAPERSAGLMPWLNLRVYPALLTMYTTGIAAVIGQREHLLAGLLASRRAREHQDWKPTVLVIQPEAVIEHNIAKLLPGLERNHTPLSDHLVATVRPWLSDMEPDEPAFERAFDRFEYLLGLVMFDLRRDSPLGGWAPVGRFSWRGKYGTPIDQEITAEATQAGRSWPLLAAGTFHGDPDRLTESLQQWNALIANVRQQQW